MSAKLVAYEYVPAGFEMVIGNPDVEMGKVWNLWWNVKLTDDPEAWDNEIRLINEMQGRLGELTMDQRLIRAQMAEFCRMHPPFPQSIDILCKEIGTGVFSKPAKMGCEGRLLLDSLGYRDLESLNAQWKETLRNYARSLEKWLAQGHSENPTESKVFGFLGQSTDGKEAFVKKLVSVIDSEEPSMSPVRELSESKCRETHGEFETFFRFRPFNCFLPACWPEGDCIPARRLCCYFMFIDAGLLCAGEFGEKTQMAGEFRSFIEEYVLVYAIAINSWLNEAPSGHVTWSETAHYIAGNGALEIAERVYSYLGEKDEAKEWLAACLLKTVKDNQRWRKRTELMDDFPEATSWFREKHDMRP